MRKINIISLCFVVLGLLIWALDIAGVFSKIDAGFVSILISWPLIIIGIIIFLVGLFSKKR